MAYGTLKCDNITFTNGGIDQTITVSGIVQSISGDITATGTIQGATIIGTSTVSGATVTGDVGVFTLITGGTAGFTTVTGANVTGTTANFATLSGTTITGGHVTTASGTYTGNVTAAAFVPTGSSVPTNGVYLPSANNVAISTSGTGRLFIDASGRVGAGISSPSVKLQADNPVSLSGSGNDYCFIAGNTSSVSRRAVAIGVDGAAGNAVIAGYNTLSLGLATLQIDGVDLRFNISGSEKARIDSSGGLGLGTSAPSGRLHVIADAITSGAGLQTWGYDVNQPSYQLRLRTDVGAGVVKYNFNLLNNGTEYDANLVLDRGNVGIGTTSPSEQLEIYSTSDHRLKVSRASTAIELFQPASASPMLNASGTGVNLRFGINDTEAARIDNSGRLLVGTSSTSADCNSVFLGSSTSNAALIHLGRATSVSDGSFLGLFDFGDSSQNVYARISASADATPGASDYPGRLVFSTTSDSASSPTERLRINNSGAIGLSGANFGTQGQVLVSNGSTAAPTWQSVTPSSVFGWNHTNDSYGLYLPGTSITTGSLSGTVDIDVQSRLRRCVINDAGVVQYYLDADDSTLKSGDWLRIVETQALNTAYTGTHSESTNSLLRVGVPAWSAGTFTRGQRVTHNGSLWECVAASTTATPAAGAVASDLTGTDGQVMVEVPAFSVRYGFASGVHTREVRLGCSDSLIAQGFQPHPAFIKTDGTYKDAFYIGAYQVTGTSPATTVSGASNRVSMTRATQRSASSARGTGWHVLAYLELAAIQTLMVTEFRDMNTQRAIGNGSQEGSVYVVNTGLSNTAGNRSQNAYTSGGAVTDYISYRGLENIYGRAWQFVDGFNVYQRVIYLSNDQTAFADNTSVGYEFYAQVPTGSFSYQKELFALPDVFLPSVVTGASSTTYLGDAFWTSTGWRVAYVGGGSVGGAQVGAFTLSLSYGSGDAHSSISARLAYAAN